MEIIFLFDITNTNWYKKPTVLSSEGECIMVNARAYTVQRGDSLWKIAKTRLGDPLRWPELYAYNNRPDVVAKSGRKIADPDLIFIGQTLFIPYQSQTLSHAQCKALQHLPCSRAAKEKVRSPAFKYDLDQLGQIVLLSPAHTVTVTLKGNITLQSRDAIDAVTLSQKGVEITAKHAKEKADNPFARLMSEIKVDANFVTKEIRFSAGFTAHASTPYSPQVSAELVIMPPPLPPILKASIQTPELKGKIDDYFYVTNTLTIEIEVTPKHRLPDPKPLHQPVSVLDARPLPRSNNLVVNAIGTAFIVGAIIVIVATIAEDIATAGVGITNDAPSFLVVAAMFQRGFQLIIK